MSSSNKSPEIFKLDINYLNRIPLFDRLRAAELRLLAKYMNFTRIKKGNIFMKEGDKGNFVCFIVTGTVEIIKEGQGGKFAIINTLTKGRSIGEMSLIDETPRSATLRASTDVVLIKLTKKGFDLMLEHYHSTGIKILKGLARLLSMNLRKTSGRLADYMTPLA